MQGDWQKPHLSTSLGKRADLDSRLACCSNIAIGYFTLTHKKIMSQTPINVAVGILMKPNGDVLLGQRPAGKPYEGYWEFPGGKVEPDESIFDALKREFVEELGVKIVSAEAWCCVEYVYPHAHVRLHFYISHEWHGEPQSLEGQAFAWQGAVSVSPLLPATIPLLECLDLWRY